ncbi:MAG: MFS transporter [Candidatus Izemoplasmataceae bacterium]
MDRSHKYLLWITVIYGFLFFITNPSMPAYLDSLDIGGRFIGMYLASGGLGLLLFSTIWGSLGDIKDRKKILGIIFIGYAVGQALFGLFSDPYLLLVAALISGFFVAGVLVNLYAYINDNVTEEQERNKMLSYAVSLYMMGGSLAYIFGAILTNLLRENLSNVFFIQAGVLLIFGVYIYFAPTDLKDTDHHLSRQNLIEKIKEVGRLPWVPIYTITLTFFISFAHNNVRRFLDYYIIDDGYNATVLGFILFFVGFVSLISNLWIAPFFLKRFHNFRFLQFQFLFAPLFLFLTFRTDNLLIGLYSFYLLYTVMLAIYEPTAISFMSDNRAVSQGVLVGVRQSIVGLGTTLGFLAGGFIYQVEPIYVFHLSVILLIIVFIGFTILIELKKVDVKSYRENYIKGVFK